MGGDGVRERLVTRDFVLITGVAFIGSITYFCLFINMVGFTADRFGTAIGAYLLGAIMPFTGMRGMFLSCIVIALVSLAMYWVAFGHRYGGRPVPAEKS